MRRRTVLVVVAGVVLVAALAVIAVGQWSLHERRGEERRVAAIRDAAESAVTAVLSYDYRRLEAGVADTTPLLTGDAEREYADVQEPLARSAPGLKAVVSADVKESTVLESDDDNARVLLFVDQLSQSRRIERPQLDQSRVVVTMEREGDDWLVSTLAAV
ncbi:MULTISPECIES: hypothetical protein [unclassified Nocardioides]|uniref:hypothetical protein n=1 Tax=unclassified Nocardioides TaxID=2615069 RepID=UPI00361B702E